jgi:hypothetical protein
MATPQYLIVGTLNIGFIILTFILVYLSRKVIFINKIVRTKLYDIAIFVIMNILSIIFVYQDMSNKCSKSGGPSFINAVIDGMFVYNVSKTVSDISAYLLIKLLTIVTGGTFGIVVEIVKAFIPLNDIISNLLFFLIYWGIAEATTKFSSCSLDFGANGIIKIILLIGSLGYNIFRLYKLDKSNIIPFEEIPGYTPPEVAPEIPAATTPLVSATSSAMESDSEESGESESNSEENEETNNQEGEEESNKEDKEDE